MSKEGSILGLFVVVVVVVVGTSPCWVIKFGGKEQEGDQPGSDGRGVVMHAPQTQDPPATSPCNVDGL
jgi:hypothetical protein